MMYSSTGGTKNNANYAHEPDNHANWARFATCC